VADGGLAGGPEGADMGTVITDVLGDTCGNLVQLQQLT
jgi:hypothetical protein